MVVAPGSYCCMLAGTKSEAVEGSRLWLLENRCACYLTRKSTSLRSGALQQLRLIVVQALRIAVTRQPRLYDIQSVVTASKAADHIDQAQYRAQRAYSSATPTDEADPIVATTTRRADHTVQQADNTVTEAEQRADRMYIKHRVGHSVTAPGHREDQSMTEKRHGADHILETKTYYGADNT